jgi:taurine---2-oxoglutarate transaminase
VPQTLGTEARIHLGSIVPARDPRNLQYIPFRDSGPESIESAIEIARRSKVYGTTAAAFAISSDPRRYRAEPSTPDLHSFRYTNCYRFPFNQTEPPDCNFAYSISLQQRVTFDGSEGVAAVVLDPVVEINGIYSRTLHYMQGIRAIKLRLCRYAASGWRRSGRWFACEDCNVASDILVTIKKITSGYVPPWMWW